MKEFEGKIALVTGAASGIGQAIAIEYARRGASVILADRDQADETVALIDAAGGTSVALSCDISSQEDVRRLAREVTDRFGKLDILVNNAGIYAFAPLEQATLEVWDRVFATNVRGAFICVQEFLGLMKKADGGKIINIASGVFYLGLPYLTAYVASKGALIGMSRSLASELSEFNIQVNVITPGIVETKGVAEAGVGDEFIEAFVQRQCIKRLEQPSDLVGAAVFLASGSSDFMTGQILNVDGGLVMK